MCDVDGMALSRHILVSLLRFFMSTLFGINPVVDSRLRSRIRHRHSMDSENFRFIRRFSDRLYLLVRQCRPSARARSVGAPPA